MVLDKYRKAEEGEEPTTVIMKNQNGRVTILDGMVKAKKVSGSGGIAETKPRYTKAQLEHAAELRTIAVQRNLITNRRKVLEVAVLQCMTGFQNQVSLAPSPRLQDHYGSDMLNSIEESAAVESLATNDKTLTGEFKDMGNRVEEVTKQIYSGGKNPKLADSEDSTDSLDTKKENGNS